jgi:hypothetical protein
MSNAEERWEPIKDLIACMVYCALVLVAGVVFFLLVGWLSSR